MKILVARTALASAGLFLAACASSAPIAPPAPIEVATDEAPVEPRAEPLLVATSTSRPTAKQPPPTCDVDLAQRIGPRCRVVFPSKVTATTRSDNAAAAFDGSTCTTWNAGGFAPASVTIDLGEAIDIDAFVLVAEMTPDGNVTHRIEVSDDGVQFAPSQRIEAPMQSGVPVDLRLPRREHARFVRFATDSSPSWVAWREIAVVHCERSRVL